MGLDTAETPKANGLKTALDIIIAPKEAFESLRVAPTWGWALVILLVLLTIGYAMQRPANLHAAVGTTQHMMATNSLFSSMTDEQKQKAIDSAAHPPAYQAIISIVGLVIGVFFAMLLNAVFLLIGNIAGRGNARFGNLWAGSVNVGIPSIGIAYIVLGFICLLLGPDHFEVTTDILRAVPGIAMLTPGVHGVLGGTLLFINIFTLWGFFLDSMLLRVTAGVTSAVSWIVPLVILLGGALLQGALIGAFGG